MRKFICLVLTASSLTFSAAVANAQTELRLGSKDAEMTKIQSSLMQKGYLEHKADGFFGLSTLAAIIKFQEDNDIYVSGTINIPTRELLYNQQIQDNISQDSEGLYWLSRIVYAESRGETYEGKLAVANCVLNRVKSDIYPNTIKDVIFDKKHGIQFEPVANGTIYNTPDETCIKAAEDALKGKNNIGECLFFFNPAIAQSSWISQNRVYYTTIGNHSFYL